MILYSHVWVGYIRLLITAPPSYSEFDTLSLKDMYAPMSKLHEDQTIILEITQFWLTAGGHLSRFVQITAESLNAGMLK